MATIAEGIQQTISDWSSEVNSKKTRKKRNESLAHSKNPSTRAQVGDRTANREKAYRDSTTVSNFES